MTKFLDSGRKYSLMVDWEGRMSREVPFLKKVLKSRGITSGKVLDTGCGPGRHALSIAAAGYEVTALDSEEEMLKEIKSGKIKTVLGNFLDTSILGGKTFDGAYSLGNTVALMASGSCYEKILQRFSSLLRPGGALVFQTLNFQKERNSFSNPRSVSVKEGEYIFLRRFSTTEKFLKPLIITLFKGKNSRKWELEVDGPVELPRISSREMENIIRNNGFEKVNLYGSYQGEPFEREKSVDMIWMATRK